ncbi:transposase [Nitrospira sp. Kam-Ns4a]
MRKAFGDIWGQGQSLHFYGIVLYAASRFSEAVTKSREAVTLLERTGDRWEANNAGFHIAFCLYRMGELRDALAVSQRVHQMGQEIGDTQAAVVSLEIWSKVSAGNVPWALLETELQRHSEDAQTLARKIHDWRHKKVIEARNCAIGAVLRHFYRQLGGNSMATDCIPQVTFEFYDKLQPVVARFDQAQASTDGGAVLLKALDDQLQLTDQLAGCLVDRRDPDKIRHTVRDLLRQRIFGLACGYEDGNDAARLANDPLHKLAVGRDPLTGAALASQPTLSRFENAVGPWALARMGRTMAATVIYTAPLKEWTLWRVSGRSRVPAGWWA